MDATYLLNSCWVLVASALVFMMQAGFACCESGFSRGKNACNIWLKNLCDFCVGAIVYYFIGFGIMYGKDFHGLFGISGFFNPLGQDLPVWETCKAINVSPHIYLLFQTMFCATTATIISGSVAERFRFDTYLIVSAVMTGLVYPVIGHWVWGGGWLGNIGFVDFAGSGAVHMVGGFAAFVCAALVGPRMGKYDGSGNVHAIPGHNIPMAMLGGFILWAGWYGFNPGSELAFDETTIYTTITTTMAGAAGGIAGLLCTWIKYKMPDPTLAMNGALAGLVASCSAINEFTVVGSVIVGLICGTFLPFSVEFFDKKLHVDDPAGAISLHGTNGVIGVILAGLLAKDSGLFYGHGASRLLAHLAGLGAIAAWVIGSVFIIGLILKKTVGIRVMEEVELEGLDSHEHAMVAYVS